MMLARNEAGEWVVVLGSSSVYGNHLYTRPRLVDVVVNCGWWLSNIGLCQAENQEHVNIVADAMKAHEDAMLR